MALLGRVDFELVIGRRIVTAVAGIGVEPFDRVADDRGNGDLDP
jgi:hypothetical protein